MSTSTLLFYIFFGSLAFAYIVYGKKQKNILALIAGAGMAAVPYFSLELWVMVLLSVLLALLPFVKNLRGA